MKSILLYLFCLVATACTSDLLAQSSPPSTGSSTPEAQPILQNLPDGMTMQKTYHLKAPATLPPGGSSSAVDPIAAADAEFALHQIIGEELTRSGSLMLSVLHRQDHTTQQFWTTGHVIAYTSPDSPRMVEIFPLLSTSSSNSDYPELAWISTKNFQRKETKDGHETNLYLAKDMQAWIDRKTSMPVRSETPNSVITYDFRPATELHLPAAVAAKIRDHQKVSASK